MEERTEGRAERRSSEGERNAESSSSSSAAMRTILPRTLSRRYSDFEYSAHYAPKSMVFELRHVFSGVDLREDNTIVIPTCQMASVTLTNWGDEQAKEKDRLLERFLVWGKELRAEFTNLGIWADFTDPCTGLPYCGPSGGSIYPDVDGFERLLHYKIDGSMGCRIMSHPEWRFASYPATFFTTADKDLVIETLQRLNT